MTDENSDVEYAAIFDDKANAADALYEKLLDAQTPGYQVEFDPEEATMAGAFLEDGLSEREATESDIDLLAEVGADIVPRGAGE
jgi:hypothetical protein